MKHEDDEFDPNIFDDVDDWNFKRVDKSRPPLRWIANLFGSWAAYHIVKAFRAQDNNKDYACYVHGYMGHILMKPYMKWGTFYERDMR